MKTHLRDLKDAYWKSGDDNPTRQPCGPCYFHGRASKEKLPDQAKRCLGKVEGRTDNVITCLRMGKPGRSTIRQRTESGGLQKHVHAERSHIGERRDNQSGSS